MKLKNITIHRFGQNYGPYPQKRVIDFLDQGLVFKTDLAWYPGITEWVSLGEALCPKCEISSIMPQGLYGI